MNLTPVLVLCSVLNGADPSVNSNNHCNVVQFEVDATTAFEDAQTCTTEHVKVGMHKMFLETAKPPTIQYFDKHYGPGKWSPTTVSFFCATDSQIKEIDEKGTKHEYDPTLTGKEKRA